MGGTGRKIILATLVAGTLDILSAVVYTLIAQHTPIQMLQSIAHAVLGPAAFAGGDAVAALLGLVIHFAIMAVMAAFFILAAVRIPLLKKQWVLAGIVYGVGLWAVMNLIVLPARFGFHPFATRALVEQLFSHIVLVGLPIAWFARR